MTMGVGGCADPFSSSLHVCFCATAHRKSPTDSTLAWLDPVCLTGRAKRSLAMDVYSFGVFLWEVASCRKPYGYAFSRHNFVATPVRQTLH